jgi:hypothetical protein
MLLAYCQWQIAVKTQMGANSSLRVPSAVSWMGNMLCLEEL